MKSNSGAAYASSPSLPLHSSAEIKRIHQALEVFKQLESQSRLQLVDEKQFLDALNETGSDDRTAREILDILHNAGQVYEIKPHQYRIIL